MGKSEESEESEESENKDGVKNENTEEKNENKNENNLKVTLISEHSALALKIARKYQKRYPQLADEILGEANLALVDAAKRCETKHIDETVMKYFAKYIRGKILHLIQHWIGRRLKIVPVIIVSQEQEYDETEDMLKAVCYSETEIKIIEMRLAGYWYHEIAAALNMTEPTLTRRVQNIQEKWLGYMRRH